MNRDTYFFAFVSSAGVFLRCITASAKFGSFIKKKGNGNANWVSWKTVFKYIFKCNKRFTFDGNIFKVLLVI